MNDSLLWARFKTGCPDAFSSIYGSNFKILFYYGCRLTSNRDLVKDSIHDLFLDLWIRRANLGETLSIKYYLIKCLKRRITKAILRVDVPDQDHGFECVVSPEEILVTDEQTAINTVHFRKMLLKLTKRQREAIHLRFYNGLDARKIASAMSLSTKAAANLISKGIVALRSGLKGNDAAAFSHPLDSSTLKPIMYVHPEFRYQHDGKTTVASSILKTT
jgi:RNA polymerase sigma factor (sigma-70 family)